MEKNLFPTPENLWSLTLQQAHALANAFQLVYRAYAIRCLSCAGSQALEMDFIGLWEAGQLPTVASRDKSMFLFSLETHILFGNTVDYTFLNIAVVLPARMQTNLKGWSLWVELC